MVKLNKYKYKNIIENFKGQQNDDDDDENILDAGNKIIEEFSIIRRELEMEHFSPLNKIKKGIEGPIKKITDFFLYINPDTNKKEAFAK